MSDVKERLRTTVADCSFAVKTSDASEGIKQLVFLLCRRINAGVEEIERLEAMAIEAEALCEKNRHIEAKLKTVKNDALDAAVEAIEYNTPSTGEGRVWGEIFSNAIRAIKEPT